MKSIETFFHCGEYLRKSLINEIGEIESVVKSIPWISSFHYSDTDITHDNQSGYNKAFAVEFERRGWEMQPLLRQDPKLIGDFRKNLVFVEVQFGNSSALYRDYYKFQYGLANGLLSLAILIVPTKPKEFFPNRPNSVQNMAEYDLANTCLTVLPINVPTLLIGLVPG
jgi:hypothetical protein